MGNIIAYNKAKSICIAKHYLPRRYFIQRDQEHLYNAWLYYKYIQEKKHELYLYKYKPLPKHLLIIRAKDFYNKLKDSTEFKDFCKWMGPILI